MKKYLQLSKTVTILFIIYGIIVSGLIIGIYVYAQRTVNIKSTTNIPQYAVYQIDKTYSFINQREKISPSPIIDLSTYQFGKTEPF
jgi:hypothetical protein